MTRLHENDVAGDHNPRWVAFWQILLEEARLLDAREAEKAAAAEAEKR